MLLPSLDPSAVLQFVLSAIAVLFGSLLLVRKASSRYFVVDGMSIGGAGDGDGARKGCTCCGKSSPPPRKCTRCQSVAYCSTACQSKHWEAGHKVKCKQARSPDKVGAVPSENDACRRKKTSGFGPVSLIPARGKCNLLQEPKRILFPYEEFVKLFEWDCPGFPPCGLLNCGNSCFANVVLQCLTCTRPLSAYLLEKNHTSGCIRKQEGWCFLCELQVHVQRAFRNREPFSPLNILSRLPHIGGNLGYGSQEDAHEFMRFAIDTMQSVCLEEYGGEKALDPSTQETTLIQHIFGGHLQSQVICTKCNTVSNRYENMMDLTVEIHGDAESLEECLEQFTVKEWLDGENMYKCDGCNDYVKAWKRLTVHQAPNILTVALKRFQSGRFGKLNKRVTFPEDLNLTPYMSGNEDVTDVYSLYAVVVHLDMLNASYFGHYICYIKDFGGHWYRIDDCKVTIVDVEEVLSQGAYMLLYSRRSPRKEPFIRPTKPAKKEQLTLGDNDLSNTAKTGDSSCALASLPSNASSQSNLSLGDTGHDRDIEIKFDGLRGKESGGVESVTRAEVNPVLDPKDLGDVDMTNSDLCSPVVKNLEGHSSQFSQVSMDMTPVSVMDSNLVTSVTHAGAEGEAMECEEYNGRCDAGFCVEEGPASLAHSEEVSTSSGYAMNGSFSCKNVARNMVHGMGETSSCASASSSVVVDPEGLCGFNCKSESVRIAGDFSVNGVNGDFSVNGVNKLADSCSSQGSETLATCSENVSSVKPKPMFSRGFLDRPIGEGSLDCEGSSQSNVPVVVVVPKSNGFTTSAGSELSSDWTKNGSSRKQKLLLSHGFLDRPTGENSVDHERPQLDVPKVDDVPSPSGFTNGHLKLDSDANCASLKSFCDGNQNGSSGKLKPLLSRGFLDRPTGEKSAACERTQSDLSIVNVVPKANGFTNGHLELDSDANSASSESFSDRTKNGSLRPDSSDMDFMAPGFLKKRPSGKPAAGLKNVKINSKGSVGDLAFRSEASCSSWTSGTSSNGAA